MKGYLWGILLILVVILCNDNQVYAAELRNVQNISGAEQEQDENLLETMDFSDLDQVLEELFPGDNMCFGDAVRQIMSGNAGTAREVIGQMIWERIWGAWESNRMSLVHLILLAIVSAVFISFSDIFQTRQVSQISFYLIYLLVIGVCLASFQSAAKWMTDGLKTVTGFMKVLYPVYFAAVTVAKGNISSAAFYHLAILLIIVVEEILLYLIVPAIQMYVMIRILNSMQTEDYLSKFAELMETMISWGVKAMMGGMIGLNVIQGMLGPVIDTVKRNTVTKGMEAIPGVGDMLGGTTEVLMGTAVLIKNSIGIAGMLVCLALCVTPLLQLAVITLGYKLAAAAVQPVSDSRITECISSVGDGCRMLLNCVFAGGMLFLITIAIVAYTTGM